MTFDIASWQTPFDREKNQIFRLLNLGKIIWASEFIGHTWREAEEVIREQASLRIWSISCRLIINWLTLVVILIRMINDWRLWWWWSEWLLKDCDQSLTEEEEEIAIYENEEERFWAPD